MSEEFVAVLKHFGIYKPEEKYKIVCPFHGDKNASLQINIDKGYFFCYGCGAHGGSFELIHNYKPELSSLQVYSFLRKICGGKLKTKETETKKENINYKQLLSEAKNFYYTLPECNWFKPSKNDAFEEEAYVCRSYMNRRGFSNASLKKFGAKPTFNKYYPIVFPILENGLFRGYVMRTFDKEVEENRKYMYNRGFRRERTLAGNYKKLDVVVVVEGYLDCLKAQQLGVNNVVATLGWKPTGTQLEKLKNNKTKCIICATDNDDAGVKGYKYWKRISSNYGFNVVRLRYPAGIKDFGDLNKDTRQAELVLKQIKKFNSLFTNQ